MTNKKGWGSWKHCDTCGAAIGDATVCDTCGEPVVSSEQTCDFCGMVVGDEAECEWCGQPIDR